MTAPSDNIMYISAWPFIFKDYPIFSCLIFILLALHILIPDVMTLPEMILNIAVVVTWRFVTSQEQIAVSKQANWLPSRHWLDFYDIPCNTKASQYFATAHGYCEHGRGDNTLS